VTLLTFAQVRWPLYWGTVIWFGCMLLLGTSIAWMTSVPDSWDGAIALKVCGNLLAVQKRDGTVWLRHRWRDYRVENWQGLC
jgi:hypothetical protein